MSPSHPFELQQVRILLGAALFDRASAQIIYLPGGEVRLRTEREPTVLDRPHCLIVPAHDRSIASVRGNGLWRVQLGTAVLQHVTAAVWDEQLLRAMGLATVPAHAAAAAAAKPQLVALDAACNAAVLGIFEHIRSEHETRRARFEAMLGLEIARLLLWLRRARGATEDQPPTVRTDVAAVMAQIRSNYTEHFQLADLARQCGLTPAYFSRAFSAAAGVPVFTFITRVRIQAACELLRRSDAAIVDVAYAVGFNNVSHFNRAFRRIAGTSPGQYRREARS